MKLANPAANPGGRPPRARTLRAGALLAAPLLAALVLAAGAALPAAAAELGTRFVLLAGKPVDDGTSTANGVVVVPGTVIPLGSDLRTTAEDLRHTGDDARSLAAVAERLRTTLRLAEVNILYNQPARLAIDRVETLPPPSAASPVDIRVTLQGYNPRVATYRVQFRQSGTSITDSVVTVPRGRHAVVGGLDGPEAPYLFLLIEPAGHGPGERPGDPLFVGGDVVPPRAIVKTPPEYTQEARLQRIQGVVIVRAVIDTQGNVREVEVLKGLPAGLSEAALAAVREWKFEPATLEGEPVDVYYNLTINFQLATKEELEASR